MSGFKLQSSYLPAGDQPKAIEKLVSGIEENITHQVLMGITGSGKTLTSFKTSQILMDLPEDMLEKILQSSNLDDRNKVIFARASRAAYQLVQERCSFTQWVPRVTLAGHSSWVYSVATYEQGGQMRIVTGSEDQTARIWEPFELAVEIGRPEKDSEKTVVLQNRANRFGSIGSFERGVVKIARSMVDHLRGDSQQPSPAK